MKKKLLVIGLAFVMLFLAACGKEKETTQTEEENNKTIVFKFGDISVTKGEVYIYANTVGEKYEDKYGEGVWSIDLDEIGDDKDIDMEALVREAVIAEIVRVKTFSSHADEYDIRLSETDEQQISDRAHEFYRKLTDKDIEELELNEALAYTVMKENMLCKMVQDALIEKEFAEISNEQARMTCFYDMFFPCYTVNSSGYVKPFSKEDREAQYEKAIEACSQLATAELGENETAQDIEKLAASYGLSDSKENTLSPEEIETIYGKKIHDEIYAMKNGQYSTVIESEYGFHIFQMIELTDEEATAEKKEAMTKEAKKNLITDKEVLWRNEIDSKFTYPESVDMDIYNEIKISK